MERPSKKVKVSSKTVDVGVITSLASLSRQISPPPGRSQQPSQPSAPACPKARNGNKDNSNSPIATRSQSKIVASPIQLTHIRDLPAANNVDTVRLRDILGDPMIRECWQFNYLFDVDFLMSNFDEDVRGLVKVKVVHGSWQKEAANRIRIEVSLRGFLSSDL